MSSDKEFLINMLDKSKLLISIEDHINKPGHNIIRGRCEYGSSIAFIFDPNNKLLHMTSYPVYDEE